jgi:hypothetical protein
VVVLIAKVKIPRHLDAVDQYLKDSRDACITSLQNPAPAEIIQHEIVRSVQKSPSDRRLDLATIC